MSLGYKAISWTREKKNYDITLASGVVAYLAVFSGLGAVVHPDATAETLLIRGFGTLALFLLHVILCIGPLCRLDARFLPLLFNRRHLGVTMFLCALVHGVFSLIQFHALGDVPALVSLFQLHSFQLLGFLALMILFLMAATSHDYWLATLTPRAWKSLHMMVYVAYVLLIGHVSFGALQSETSPWLAAILCAGVVVVTGLHISAAKREADKDAVPAQVDADGFHLACDLSAIPENQAYVVSAGGERIALFRHNGSVSAISNVCAHQNGPLGEGRIIDGCVTCPWHGYQYLPETGRAPAPFTERVDIYPVKVVAGKVMVHPKCK